MNFNWNEFKKGETVVYCDTKEKAKDFLNKCVSNNIRWADTQHITPGINYFNNCGNGICYRFHNIVLGLVYETLKYFKDDDHVRIIEWKIEKGENRMDVDITSAAEKAENMLNELTTNKIDYDREYNIMEIMEFPEGTEFVNEDIYIVKFKDGILQVKNKTKNTLDSWSKCRITREWLNAKFKLAKKDRKVSFEEAIEAYNEYKTIKCIWSDDIYEFDGNKESKLTNLEEYRLLNLILNGEWYMKED
ncbi:hypothetical protein FDA84_14975 [Clostridium botulinum]|nr:hypothetical protein [Clostridium botulinum]